MVNKILEGAISNKLEFIRNEKNRKTIFKYRKNSLIKKIEQLAILCGIDVGAIIFPSEADDIGGGQKDKEIVWPEDHTKIRQLITWYKAKARPRCDASHQRPVAGASSSTSPKQRSRYDDLSVEQLNELVRIVEQRISVVDNKIDFLEKSKGMEHSNHGMPNDDLPKMYHFF